MCVICSPPAIRPPCRYDTYAAAHPDHAIRVYMEDMYGDEQVGVRRRTTHCVKPYGTARMEWCTCAALGEECRIAAFTRRLCDALIHWVCRT